MERVEPRWELKEYSNEKLSEFTDRYDLPEFYGKILISRHVLDKDDSDVFFSDSKDLLHDPFLLDDMEIAVTQILERVDYKQIILIYGDYDVDGTTGTTLLYLFLRRMGGNVHFYVPDRESEGYGLSIRGIDYAKQIGAELIVTVDCGISAVESANYAKQMGISLIITDHHKEGTKLPEALAIVNPNKKHCTYPFGGLCGAGVAFKVALAIAERRKLSPGEVWCYADLVTLGISADIVPVVNENRIIVKHGLKLIHSKNNTGINALVNSSGLRDKDITVGRLVFNLAPKINAAGRLGDAGRAVKLLSTTDSSFANEMAQELERENRRRQVITSNLLDNAIRKVNAECRLDEEPAIVLADADWHNGVIGIVASRIKELFYRPTIIISIDGNNVGKGSARSISALDMYEAISQCSEFLLDFGGHPMAAGLSIEADKIPAFRKKFYKVVDELISKNDLHPVIRADCEIKLSEIDRRLLAFLNKLAPYGPQNMRPKFISRNISVIGYPMLIGKTQETLKFNVKQVEGKGDLSQAREFPAIGFQMVQNYEKLLTNKNVDLVYEIGENEWKGNRTVQLEVKDIKISNN